MKNNNALFDDMYRRYINNNWIPDEEIPNDREKKVIKENFYLLLPLIFNELTDRQRDVMTLYYGHNQTQEQIARTLKINQSNVSVHLNQAVRTVDKQFTMIYKCSIWSLRYEKGVN